MTEEQKKNDSNRFIVVEGDQVHRGFDNEGDAKKYAQTLAENNPEEEYCVYQKIGSATATVKVEWKGQAR